MAEISILNSIKRPLGYVSDYDSFDFELIIHINSVISNLNQLGVGPRDGLVIDATTEWPALVGTSKSLENVKSYIFLRVKMLFDSGSMTPQLVAAYESMIKEQEWRLVVAADPYIPQMLPLAE